MSTNVTGSFPNELCCLMELWETISVNNHRDKATLKLMQIKKSLKHVSWLVSLSGTQCLSVSHSFGQCSSSGTGSGLGPVIFRDRGKVAELPT